jgi:hypothetical protein
MLTLCKNNNGQFFLKSWADGDIDIIFEIDIILLIMYIWLGGELFSNAINNT